MKCYDFVLTQEDIYIRLAKLKTDKSPWPGQLHPRILYETRDVIAYPLFFPNVTTLRSGLCCRNSVCRLSVRLSRLSFVTLVHPTQGVEAFGNISSPLCTLTIIWPPCKILRRSSQGNPSDGSVKRRRGITIERFWTYRRLYLINGTR